MNTYPVFSPNGTAIAFRRMLGQKNSEVFVAESGGHAVRNLTNSPAFDRWPAWSPDGTRLAFASNRNGPYQIFVMRADGTHIQLVAQTTGRGTTPKWSRDGSTIYFTICQIIGGGGDCEIYSAAGPHDAGAESPWA
ncbi:MAG: TolB family protein [Gemmatimonadaceae bacterium]